MECVELAKNYLTSGARIFLHDRPIPGKIYNSEITGTEYELMTNNVTSDAEIKAVGGYDVESGYTIVNTRSGVYLTRGGQNFYVYQRCSTPASSSSYGQYPQYPQASVTRGAPTAQYPQFRSPPIASVTRGAYQVPEALAPAPAPAPVLAPPPPPVIEEIEYVPNANLPNLIPRRINVNMNRVAFPPQRPINRERGGRMKTKRRNKNKNKMSLRRKRSKLTKA